MINNPASNPVSAASKLPDDFPDLLQKLCEIGAPTGQELGRTDFLLQWFNAITPNLAKKDTVNNVIVDLSDGASKIWLLDAHIDTVFPDISLHVQKNDTIWHCPGIADSTVNVVCLMLLARELANTGKRWPLLFSFTVGEEGLGNLKGIREITKTFRDRLRGAWIIDTKLDTVTSQAVGTKRWRLNWKADGGHSWGDFGKPSALHAMARWIAEVDSLAAWAPFHLSYNIGQAHGGTTVTSIAEQAECTLDLRSVDPKELKKASDLAVAMAHEIATRTSVELKLEAIGDRPAAALSETPPLLKWVTEIHEQLGTPLRFSVNSTNANALLAEGISATCTGLCICGGAHTRNEWLDINSAPLGWKKLWLLVERVI